MTTEPQKSHKVVFAFISCAHVKEPQPTEGPHRCRCNYVDKITAYAAAKYMVLLPQRL